MRKWLIMLTPLLVGSSEPTSLPRTMPDVIEAGRVLKDLNDSQAALYALIVIIGCLLVERFISNWQARITTEKLALSLDRMATALTVNSTDINVNIAMIRHECANILAGMK